MLKKYIITLALFAGVTGFAAVPAYTANAATCGDAASCINAGVEGAGSTGTTTDVPGLLKKIVNILLFVIGAVSVIMIVIGGIKYTTSAGDASQTKSAKDTIFYAVIGLVVAILAYAIVNFVVTNLK